MAASPADVTLATDPRARRVVVEAVEPPVPSAAAMEDSPVEGPSPEPPTALDLAVWIADLCDDDERFNAIRATRRLAAAWPHSRTWLEDGLLSPDHQQRQLCAYVLAGQDAEPTSMLLHVLVEGLRDDDLPYERGRDGDWRSSRNSLINNADRAESYLVEHVDEARTRLWEQFYLGDAQQSLRCASILATRADAERQHELIGYFVECLRDNGLRGDAARATTALIGFGDDAVPALRAATGSADVQQAGLAGAILDRIGSDAVSAFEAIERNGVRGVVRACRF